MFGFPFLVITAGAIAAPQCDTPSNNQTMFNQHDLPGGHIFTHSWQACCEKCLANPKCNVYSWDGYNCYEKVAASQPRHDVHSVSGILRSPGPPPAPGPTPGPTPPPAPQKPVYANICNPGSNQILSFRNVYANFKIVCYLIKFQSEHHPITTYICRFKDTTLGLRRP